LAGHRAADDDLVDAALLELLGLVEGNHLVFGDDLLAAVHDGGAADPTTDGVGQAALDVLALVDRVLGDALRAAAIFHGHDDVLGDIGKLARQVTRVGRLQRGIGQALTGAVRAGEVLEHAEAFLEVGLDRRLDDLAGRLGHQAAHAGQLPDLLDAAASAGVSHQEDRVEVWLALAAV